MKKEFFTQISSEKCAVTTLFGSCLCKNGDFYEILGRRVADDSFLFFTVFFDIQTIRTVPLVGLWLVVGDYSRIDNGWSDRKNRPFGNSSTC